jgi:hypothetical protein
MPRHHVTSALEFADTGILLAGTGEHSIRVLGAFLVAPPPGPLTKEERTGRLTFEESPPAPAPEPDEPPPEPAPFAPELPARFLTAAGDVEFLSRDLSGIDVASLRIPDLPESPADPGTPAEEPEA